MAILNGLLRKMSGSAGDLTFKALNGQTVVSEKMTKMTNPRSSAQMRVRTRWRNVLAMYSGIRPLLRHGFESKPVGLSDYNMFVKVNMQRTPVYLTKQQVAGGACVAAPYQLTQGSLPAIVVSGTGANAFTDIYLGGVTISGTTTVGQFSKAVVDNNEDYRYGDQISYFLVKQKVNADTQIPYCQFRACCVVLDENNANAHDIILEAFLEPEILEIFTPVVYGSLHMLKQESSRLQIRYNAQIVGNASQADPDALNFVDITGRNAVEVAKIAEDAGVAAIAVHARTRTQYYSGEADWNIIRQVKIAVKKPYPLIK